MLFRSMTTIVQAREQRCLHEEWIGESSNSPEKENRKGKNSQEREVSSYVETAGSSRNPLSSRILSPSAIATHTTINESANTTTSSSQSSRDSSRRVSRPMNFSHPVLLNDSDGTFFDRSDLRHSDSRSCPNNDGVISVRGDSRIRDGSRRINCLDLYGTDDDDDDDDVDGGHYKDKSERDGDYMNKNHKINVTSLDPKELKTFRRVSVETLRNTESKRKAW